MASIKKPKSTPCQFVVAWSGKCGVETDNGRCDEHEKLKCSSCGAKATHSCDCTMGSLVCGQPLCDTCQHTILENGKMHVTKEAYRAQMAAEKQEQELKKASRKSPVRRLHPKTNLPLNTFELLKGDWQNEGYDLKLCYYLHIDHGMAGFHPAIIKTMEDDRVSELMAFAVDRKIIIELWKLLPVRKSKIESQMGYVHDGKRIMYPHSQEKSRLEILIPTPFLDRDLFDQLATDPKKNFGWAPGVIGCDTPEWEFQRKIAEAESEVVLV